MVRRSSSPSILSPSYPGGPHHFKTKEHFYFLTTLLLYFQNVERYFFLAHFGWSAVDQWFGAMKQRVRSALPPPPPPPAQVAEFAANFRGLESIDDAAHLIAESDSQPLFLL